MRQRTRMRKLRLGILGEATHPFFLHRYSFCCRQSTFVFLRSPDGRSSNRGRRHRQTRSLILSGKVGQFDARSSSVSISGSGGATIATRGTLAKRIIQDLYLSFSRCADGLDIAFDFGHIIPCVGSRLERFPDVDRFRGEHRRGHRRRRRYFFLGRFFGVGGHGGGAFGGDGRGGRRRWRRRRSRFSRWGEDSGWFWSSGLPREHVFRFRRLDDFFRYLIPHILRCFWIMGRRLE